MDLAFSFMLTLFLQYEKDFSFIPYYTLIIIWEMFCKIALKVTIQLNFMYELTLSRFLALIN